jgi:hypothetical protein
MRRAAGWRWRKLPARAQIVVTPMILSLLMSGIVSTISTLKAVGWAEASLPRLLQAWGLSYVIAFPAALVTMPIVRRIVGRLVELPEPGASLRR